MNANRPSQGQLARHTLEGRSTCLVIPKRSAAVVSSLNSPSTSYLATQKRMTLRETPWRLASPCKISPARYGDRPTGLSARLRGLGFTAEASLFPVRLGNVGSIQ